MSRREFRPSIFFVVLGESQVGFAMAQVGVERHLQPTHSVVRHSVAQENQGALETQIRIRRLAS